MSFIRSVLYREVPLYSSYIVTHCLPNLLLGGWVHLIESTNDLNQSMETIEHIKQQTFQWHRSWLLLCTLVYDVVEAHASALNWTEMLLSNHVARRNIAVSRFDLESLCQSQTVLWLFCNWRYPWGQNVLLQFTTWFLNTILIHIYLVQLQCRYHSLFERSEFTHLWNNNERESNWRMSGKCNSNSWYKSSH